MAPAMGGDERRIDDRHSIALDAVLRAYRSTPLAVRLVDISRGGAMLALDQVPPDRGDEVVLAAKDVEVVATIAWVNARTCGLAFHRKLETRELAALRLPAA